MYSRMAVHRNLVERDLTIPLMTLALSGGACCFAIVFCMDKYWYAESPEEISNWISYLWLSVGSFIQVQSNEVSILIPTCQQENHIYISSMSLLATSRLNNDLTISWCFRVWAAWCLGWSNVLPKQTFLVTASAQGHNNEDPWFMLVPYTCEPKPKKWFCNPFLLENS